MTGNIYLFLKKEKLNIGICLLSLAIAISNLISFMFYKDYSILSNIFLSVGVLLIFDFSALKNGKIFINKKRIILLFFVLYFTIFSCFRMNEFFGTGHSIIYNFFSIAIVFAFISRSEWKNKDNLIKMLFYISGVLSIILYFLIMKHIDTSAFGVSGIYDLSGKIIADRLSLTSIPLTLLVTSLCYSSKNNKERLFKIVFVIFAFMSYVQLHRRGTTIELLVFLIILLISSINIKNKISKKNIRNMFIGFFSLIIIFRILSFNNEFIERTQLLRDSMVKAVETLFGGDKSNYGVDPSAIVRYNNRQLIINEWNNYNFFDIFLGKGYMYKYLDFPLFQILIDLGIVGAVFYFFNTMYNYLIVIITRKTKMSIDKYILFISVSYFFRCFYSGVPYSWEIYFTISMIILYLLDKKKESRQNEQD